MFTVRIKFSETGAFNGKTDVLHNISEIHYNYHKPGQRRIAFESPIGGHTFFACDVDEFEAIENNYA